MLYHPPKVYFFVRAFLLFPFWFFARNKLQNTTPENMNSKLLRKSQGVLIRISTHWDFFFGGMIEEWILILRE